MKNILIAGTPGIGKTTLIMKLHSHLSKRYNITGFYTKEVRKDKTRIGFDAITFPVKKVFPIARFAREIPPQVRVGKYMVDVKEISHLVKEIRNSLVQPRDLIIIDEIGKMECLSDDFCDLVMEVLNLPTPVLATIASHGTAFIESIKKRPDVELFALNLDSRRTAFNELKRKISLLSK